jgi:hypothetical protein
MMPYNAYERDTQAVTLDNRSQREVTERILMGMSDEYTPFPEDVDTFGYDYQSVTDGLLDMMLG